MKKRYLIYGTVVCSMLAMGLTSCNNDNFLDTTLYNAIPKDFMYSSDANATTGLNGIYDQVFPNDDYDGDWGFKPNLFTGSHPTIDTQATGWDKDWNTQKWGASSEELLKGWRHVYAGIVRANDYLAGLEASTGLSEGVKKSLHGQGCALRGFFYHWLATTFGRVPMLKTGETYMNTPTKARAATYSEMWNFIIDDFKTAADELDWAPMNGQYGRCTKGMALTYLADAYMWKAYRLTDGANGQEQNENEAKKCLQEAEKCLKQVLDSKVYELSRSFTTNWDPAGAWNKETIWCEQLDEGTNWGGWNDMTSKLMLKWYTACPENGGWGSLYLSWEWWSSYEKGDKRREASGYTGAVPQIDPNNPAYDPQYEGWYEPAVYGKNPYLQEVLGQSKGADTKTAQFHFTNGEWAPSIWSAKLWRTATADYLSWSDGHWSPTPIYWKRLPNVMLDYAECRFRLYGGDDTEGWKMINELRNRAFGKLEDGHEKELTDKFLPYYNDYAHWVRNAREAAKVPIHDLTEYPIPFGSTVATVPDAKTVYTALKAKKGFDSPVWKVAVNEERRKEFNCEWCLRPDMQRSGYMADHVAHNYPKRGEASDMANSPWTVRQYTYDDRKMDMPIPADELTKNTECDQNEAYRADEK